METESLYLLRGWMGMGTLIFFPKSDNRSTILLSESARWWQKTIDRFGQRSMASSTRREANLV
jgi:hypothetical protein